MLRVLRNEAGERKPPPRYSLRCSPLLPYNPADQEAATHEQRTGAKREERRGTDTTRLRQRLGGLIRRSRGRSRSSLRRRRRSGSGLGRLGLTRNLSYNPTSLGDDVPVLTLGLGGGAAGFGLIGLGVGHDRSPDGRDLGEPSEVQRVKEAPRRRLSRLVVTTKVGLLIRPLGAKAAISILPTTPYITPNPALTLSTKAVIPTT
jgi:hypothetical protein